MITDSAIRNLDSFAHFLWYLINNEKRNLASDLAKRLRIYFEIFAGNSKTLVKKGKYAKFPSCLKSTRNIWFTIDAFLRFFLTSSKLISMPIQI